MRSRRASQFQRPSSLRTRFKLGSVSSSREISSRPRTSDVNRTRAVTSGARSMGSAPNAGSSLITRFSRSNPGCGRKRRCTDPISTGRATARLREFAMRDFRRETPGRKRNKISRMATATAAIRRREERRVTSPLAAFAATESRQKSATPHAPEIQFGPQNRSCDTDRSASQTTSK